MLDKPQSDVNDGSTPAGEAGRVRVMVADPHPLLVDGLASRIAAEPDMTLIDGVIEVAVLIDEVARAQPDVAIVAYDLWTPPQAQLPPHIVRAIAARTHLILIYDQIAPHEVWSSLSAGARALVSRGAAPGAFIDAIRTALTGGTHLDPPIQRELAELIRHRGRDAEVAMTGRERTILRLSADGLTTSEIAKRLDLSASSVKAALHAIYIKLDVRDRPAAVAQALRRGLIT